MHVRAHRSRRPGAKPDFWLCRSFPGPVQDRPLIGSRHPVHRLPGSPPPMPSRRCDAPPERTEIATLAQFGNAQINVTQAGLPETLAVSIAAVTALATLDVVAGTAQHFDIQFHQTLGDELDHVLEQIGIRLFSASSPNAIVALVIVVLLVMGCFYKLVFSHLTALRLDLTYTTSWNTIGSLAYSSANGSIGYTVRRSMQPGVMCSNTSSDSTIRECGAGLLGRI